MLFYYGEYPAYERRHHGQHLSALDEHEVREVSQVDHDGGVEKVRLERGLKGGLWYVAWWLFWGFYTSFHFQIPKPSLFLETLFYRSQKKIRMKIFKDILAGFTFNNRVLRLPAIVLLNTEDMPNYEVIGLGFFNIVVLLSFHDNHTHLHITAIHGTSRLGIQKVTQMNFATSCSFFPYFLVFVSGYLSVCLSGSLSKN